ncbi:MAG: Uncharacterized protein AWU55_412 [Halomonadaceae bacterium T82-2]|nr:MAG: Uncharacterized protein AWU55_412 [Halomonadaceae bacterium T82-2]
MPTRWIALAAPLLWLWGAGPARADASAATGLDCLQLTDASTPDTPRDWLERSLWASHCYEFRARAVRISGDGVRTLALSHDVENGVEREIASYLDGPPVVYERRGRVGRGSPAEAIGTGRAAPAAILARLDGHYQLTLDGASRVAGRDVVRLNIESQDNLRYGHRLWLDKRTGLPLKQVMVGLDGRVLETFQMTELGEPSLYDGTIDFEPLATQPSSPWAARWLPTGYHALPLPNDFGVRSAPVAHRLYSDGLSSFSLFIEPVQRRQRILRAGMHRLGITHAAVRHVRLGERVFQIVAIGEVPPMALARVVEGMEYRPPVGAR